MRAYYYRAVRLDEVEKLEQNRRLESTSYPVNRAHLGRHNCLVCWRGETVAQLLYTREEAFQSLTIFS